MRKQRGGQGNAVAVVLRKTRWIVEIALSNGGSTIIDRADFDLVKNHGWFRFDAKRKHVHRKRHPYAMTRIKSESGWRHVFMHRLLLNTPEGQVTDHKDGDGLNNRRDNIRICTQRENARNQKRTLAGTSNYKGVSWSRVQLQWHAYIMVDYKRIHLGYFELEERAARAYDFAAAERFGAFASLNFPKDLPKFTKPDFPECPHGFRLRRGFKATMKCGDCIKQRNRDYYRDVAGPRKATKKAASKVLR